MIKKITIAAPVYNELINIDKFVSELFDTIKPLSSIYDFRVLLINDGSDDGTEKILEKLVKKHGPFIKVVNLTRNYGHSAACAACVRYAEGDALILMDSDLQDDPAAIPLFLEKWEQGYQVVYATRTTRQENIFARFLFKSFYRFFNLVSAVKIPLDAGNFSLIDEQVYTIIRDSYEKNAYFPGVRTLVGFRQIGIPVARRPRQDGRSRVGYSGLFNLARNAIFSFSFLPIRIFNFLGGLALLLCFLIIIYALYYRLFTDIAVPAWASSIITISFFGGINLLGIGIVGEYVARIYDQVRRFPGYYVREIIEDEKE